MLGRSFQHGVVSFLFALSLLIRGHVFNCYALPDATKPENIAAHGCHWWGLGNCRSPCACLANDFASENRAGGLRLYWQVCLLVGRARAASCYLLRARTETLGFAPTDGMVRQSTITWLARRSSAGWLPNLHILLPVPFTAQLFGGAFWPHQPERTSVEPGLCRRQLEPPGARCTLVCFSPFPAFFVKLLHWHQSTVKFATFWFSSSCQKTQCLSLLPCPVNF